MEEGREGGQVGGARVTVRAAVGGCVRLQRSVRLFCGRCLQQYRVQQVGSARPRLQGAHAVDWCYCRLGGHTYKR